MTALLDAAAAVDPRVVLLLMLGALDVWATTLVWFSTSATRDKVLWTVIIIGCPIIGCFFWYVFGPKWRPRSS
ncbi:MAG: PLDc N-terminal domain-containing protein [Gemmatimonadetes bacterium]|nr:PLDc N-terminal domain-containing protein [Gemmatimonadota bacterium]